MLSSTFFFFFLNSRPLRNAAMLMTLWLSKKGYRIGWVSSIFLHHRNVGVGFCKKCCQCPTHIFQHCPNARSFCPVPELNSLPEDLSTHTEAGHKYGNCPQPMMKGNWLMNSPVSSPLMIEVEGNLQIWSWNKQPQCHVGAHGIRNSEGSAQTLF